MPRGFRTSPKRESRTTEMGVMPLKSVSVAVVAIMTPASIVLWSADRSAECPSEIANSPSHFQAAVDYQSRSNSVPWDQDRWRPWTIELREGDDTKLTGYNAELHGNVRLTSADDVEPRKTPFGFLGPQDTLTWTVVAESPGTYKTAVLYHPGDPDNVGSQILISDGDSQVIGRIHPVKTGTWVGGPQDRPSFRRDWFEGSIYVHAGRNLISLHVVPTTRQVELARRDLERPQFGWPKRSLHIAAIEMARPEVLAKMRMDAPRLRSDTSWMVRGKYGLFIHWVPESYPLFGSIPAWQRYQAAVAAFDVDAFADMVAKTGAAWVVFTTTHGKYYFPAPLHALDKILPGRTCRRDLISEIANALAKQHVRLMLYFHPGPGSSEDPEWARRAGIDPVDDPKNRRIMLSLYREIGRRYGTRLAGWFIDGGDAYYWRNYSFLQLELALKEGNPRRVITFFQWLWPKFSPYGGDFLSDLTDFGAPLAPPFPRAWLSPGGPYFGLQPQFDFTLEDEWYPDKPMNGRWPRPIYSTSTLVQYVQRMAAEKWPLTINIVISQDVTKQQPFVNPLSLKQLMAAKAAFRSP